MLIILTSHPIQYQTPLWKTLAQETTVPFEVCFLSRHGTNPSYDKEFNHIFAWDIPMLDGYPHTFLDTSHEPTSRAFFKTKLPPNFSSYLKNKQASHLWVHGWNTLAHWQAIHIAHALGLQTWLSSESHLLGQHPIIKQIIKRTLLTHLFKKIDIFLSIGTANRAFYKSFSIPDYKIHKTPYSVDNLRFHRQIREAHTPRETLKKQWHIPPDAYVLLFCGKLIPKKRPHDLIRAAIQYAKKHLTPSLHLLFVGTGSLEPELKASTHVTFDYSNSTPISLPDPSSHLPTASFTGFLNQSIIHQAYLAADALVLPSDARETWGLVANEALACGRPCIISDTCGCAQDLGTLPPNQIYPCGDIDALSRAIHHLTQISYDPQQIFKDFINSGHNIPYIVSQIDKIYSHHPSCPNETS